MISYRKFLVEVGEAYFTEAPMPPRVDIVRYLWLAHQPAGFYTEPFHTIVIDLSQPEDVLFNRIKSDTRYEIGRARGKDGVACNAWFRPSQEVVDRFCALYDNFAKLKNLRAVNRARLKALNEVGALVLTCARRQGEEPLVWHAYISMAQQARLLYSASLFRQATDASVRNAIGRANRYLHWFDIMEFKSRGFAVLDLGGWYVGQTDRERLAINAFKQEFGGDVVQRFNCERAVSLKGQLAIWLRDLILKWR